MGVAALVRVAAAATLLVAVAVAVAGCGGGEGAAFQVSGTVLEDGGWRIALDEASGRAIDAGEAALDVGWRTSVRCTDGSRVRRSDVRAGWEVEVVASGMRGEHLPTLVAERVRVGCTDDPLPAPPDPSRRTLETPEPGSAGR